ncbi:polysaccharide biosynthesis C-terminal domain-containing protein [Flavobacterium sp. RNTU_13]|uniref:oligosaccharide flippase family protein n=1 Tax=Flavobacterium sp. RNTU_13 TaxID=3375145 RepID=UPI0039860F3C
MSLHKKLLKDTAIYGIATVVPRLFSFILNPLYVMPGVMDMEKFAQVSINFSWLVFFNVILSYGMETSFFRFYNTEDKKDVVSTTTISLFWSSLAFLVLGLVFRGSFAWALKTDVEYMPYIVWVLVLDALTIAPFSKLRADSRPLYYSVVKIGSVCCNVLLNFFFLLFLPKLANAHPGSIWDDLFTRDFQVGYVFVANVISSLFALLLLIPHYFKISWHFNKTLWKRMMNYSIPVMFAGIAFAINEVFDRPLLSYMHVAKDDIAKYSACYKLALFMTLFTTAFRLGIEPFFFSHASKDNARQTYATITKYFVILGSVILLGVVVFADVLKYVIVPTASYWEGMKIVPVIVLANLCLGIYTNLSVWYKLADRTKMGAYISGIGAIITILFNIALIPVWGYMGSAIATLSAYGTMMLVSYVIGAKYYPIPYDVKTMGTYMALAVVLSGISFYVPVLRHTYVFGVVALLGFIFFVYRNEKHTLLKLVKK